MQKLLNDIYEKLDEVISSTNFLPKLYELDIKYSMHGYIPNEFLGHFKSFAESFGFSIIATRKKSIEINFYRCASLLRGYARTLRESPFSNKHLLNYGAQFTELISIALMQANEGKTGMAYHQLLAELAFSRNFFEQIKKRIPQEEDFKNDVLRYANYYKNALDQAPVIIHPIIVPKIYINRINWLCKEMQHSSKSTIANKTRILNLQEIRNTLNMIKNEPYNY